MKIWEPLYTIQEADKIIVGFDKSADRLRCFFNKTYTYDPQRGRDLFDEKIIDLGNITLQSFSKIFPAANKNAKWIFIGKDHSVTPKITSIVKPKTLLSLDAHLDLLDTSKSRYKKKHAQAMKDVFEQGVKVLIRGVRTGAREEREYADENNMDWSRKLNFAGKVDYLSIDVDVLDPIYAETSTPETFGFTPKEVADVIHRTHFKYADIVEWSPDYGFPAIVGIFKELLFK